MGRIGDIVGWLRHSQTAQPNRVVAVVVMALLVEGTVWAALSVSVTIQRDACMHAYESLGARSCPDGVNWTAIPTAVQPVCIIDAHVFCLSAYQLISGALSLRNPLFFTNACR